MIKVPTSDKYIIAYDDRGKALVYIAYDTDSFNWSISLHDDLKELYISLFKRLDEFGNSYFNEVKIVDHRFFEVSFVQKATDVLNIVRLTCPDWSKYRLPDFLLDEEGDLNMVRLNILRKMRRIDVKTALPCDSDEKKQLAVIIPHLFDLVNDERMWGDETLRLDAISLSEFESRLVNLDLRYAWFECRDEATKFYCFSDDSYEFYFAMNKLDIPMFMFFLPILQNKDNDLDNWDGSKAA